MAIFSANIERLCLRDFPLDDATGMLERMLRAIFYVEYQMANTFFFRAEPNQAKQQHRKVFIRIYLNDEDSINSQQKHTYHTSTAEAYKFIQSATPQIHVLSKGGSLAEGRAPLLARGGCGPTISAA